MFRDGQHAGWSFIQLIRFLSAEEICLAALLGRSSNGTASRRLERDPGHVVRHMYLVLGCLMEQQQNTKEPHTLEEAVAC